MQMLQVGLQFTMAALFALFTTSLPGCVLVPVPTALGDPEPFTPEKLAWIQPGRTTSDEVRAAFGNWTYETDDGIQTVHIEPQVSQNDNIWIFGLPRQLGDIAYAGLVAYFPVLFPVLLDKQDNYEHYWVLVEFDDGGTVESARIARERASCADGGVCYRHGRLLLIANEAANRAARSDIPPNDGCVLFSYAKDDFDEPIAISFLERTGQLFGNVAFVRTELPQGRWIVSATPARPPEPESDSIPTTSLEVTCTGHEILYVELSRQDGKLMAKPTNESTGAHAVAKRHIVERAIPVVAPAPPGVAATK